MTKFEAFNNTIVPKLHDKILVLTHTDADGSGANIIIKSIFPNVTTKYCSNATMSYDIKNAICHPEEDYDFIFACDISCNEEDAIKIDAHPNHKKLLVLDHHLTASHLNKYKWACVQSDIIEDSYRMDYYPDNTPGLSSGTSLVFDYMEYHELTTHVKNIDFLKHLVHLITSYDTWDWVNVFERNDEFNKLNTLFDIYRAELFETKMLNCINNTSIVDIFDETDELLLTIENNRIKEYINNVQKAFVTGNIQIVDTYYSIVFCTTDRYLQETFEHMKTLYPEYDIYMINYGTGISMRAIKHEINIGNIAKQFGGGGHAGAGGMKIPFELQKELIEKTMSATLYIDERQ